MSQMRMRNICITLNNPTCDPLVFGTCLRKTIATYACGQMERGASGTNHLQFYAQLAKQMRLGAIKDAFPFMKKCHIERAYGRPDQARNYALKEETRNDAYVPFEDGSIRGVGSRNIEHAVQSRMTLKEITEAFPGDVLRFGSKRINETRNALIDENPGLEPEIIVFYSSGSGTGKTFTAKKEFPKSYQVMYPQGNQMLWFDGFDGFWHDSILLEDFQCQLKLEDMIKLCDYGTLKMQVKGSHIILNTKKIIITTNMKPKYWYRKCEEDRRKVLFRRLHDFGTCCHVQKQRTVWPDGSIRNCKFTEVDGNVLPAPDIICYGFKSDHSGGTTRLRKRPRDEQDDTDEDERPHKKRKV